MFTFVLSLCLLLCQAFAVVLIFLRCNHMFLMKSIFQINGLWNGRKLSLIKTINSLILIIQEQFDLVKVLHQDALHFIVWNMLRVKLYYNFNFQFSLTVKVAANQYKKTKYPEGKYVAMLSKKVQSKFNLPCPSPSLKKKKKKKNLISIRTSNCQTSKNLQKTCSQCSQSTT